MIDRPTDPAVDVFQLRVVLGDSEPEIWRQFLVTADTPLDLLHEILQIVVGWGNCHLHVFEAGDRRYSDPQFDLERGELDEWEHSVADLVGAPGAAFRYRYDFGDNWEHEVVLERIVAVEPGRAYPVCEAGENACPPEDCGGIRRYYEMLEAVSESGHEDHAMWKAWLDPGFDAGAFDPAAVNGELAKLLAGEPPYDDA